MSGWCAIQFLLWMKWCRRFFSCWFWVCYNCNILLPSWSRSADWIWFLFNSKLLNPWLVDKQTRCCVQISQIWASFVYRCKQVCYIVFLLSVLCFLGSFSLIAQLLAGNSHAFAPQYRVCWAFITMFLTDKMLLLKLKTLFFGFANRSFAPGKPIDFFYFVIFYRAF